MMGGTTILLYVRKSAPASGHFLQKIALLKCKATHNKIKMSSTVITPSDLDYYNELISATSETSEKVNVLKNLIRFVLDNSIRESTVGHTVEDKNAILTALKGTPAVEGAP